MNENTSSNFKKLVLKSSPTSADTFATSHNTPHAPTSTPTSESRDSTSNWNDMTVTQKAQIENYREEKGLMLNFHPTHHGGTTFCSMFGPHGIHGAIAPPSACMHEGNEPLMSDCKNSSNSSNSPCYTFKEIEQFPWSKNETYPFIQAIRPYYHMISFEYINPSRYKFNRNLIDLDWDCPNLVSVYISRDPLARLLAGDGFVVRNYPGYNSNELNRSRWWDYAVYDKLSSPMTDNFALRLLASQPRPERTHEQASIPNHIVEGINRTTKEITELFPNGLNETHLTKAKAMLDKFTFVLDIECLDEGMAAMGQLLQLELPARGKFKCLKHTYRLKHIHPSPRERIPYDDVYDFLVAQNKYDIAMYEYSKSISLVRCEDLKKE